MSQVSSSLGAAPTKPQTQWDSSRWSRQTRDQRGLHPAPHLRSRIGHGGKVSFEQVDVEFPQTWSQNATNIVAQKYFRGQLDSPARERSVKQMIGRVAGTIADWGRQRGYFASAEDGDTFEAELTHILLHQIAAFNSPVWFNVGFEEQPQCSACFILSVDGADAQHLADTRRYRPTASPAFVTPPQAVFRKIRPSALIVLCAAPL